MARAARVQRIAADIVLFGACVVLSPSLRIALPPQPARSGRGDRCGASLVAPLVALQQRRRAVARRAICARERDELRARQRSRSRATRVPDARSGERPAPQAPRARRAAASGDSSPPRRCRGAGVGEEYTVTLTRGLAAPASATFSPVVAPEGLVGMVQTVDPTMSLAILWTHPDFRVSAMSADGSAFGIVQAHTSGRRARARTCSSCAACHSAATLKPGHGDRQLRAGRHLSARHSGRNGDRRDQDARRRGRARTCCGRR